MGQIVREPNCVEESHLLFFYVRGKRYWGFVCDKEGNVLISDDEIRANYNRCVGRNYPSQVELDCRTYD